jgi:hypothetical protein
VRSEDKGHLRQNLEAPGLVDGRTSQECAAIEEISYQDGTKALLGPKVGQVGLRWDTKRPECGKT